MNYYKLQYFILLYFIITQNNYYVKRSYLWKVKKEKCNF